jgi:hypothetical protein
MQNQNPSYAPHWQKTALLFIVWAQIFRMIFEDVRRPSEEASMSEHLQPYRI